MTEKTATGWVVQLTIPGTATASSQWRGPPLMDAATFRFFNVAIASADKAIEATRKKVGASEEALMRTVRPLSAAEISFEGMRTGDVKPA